MSGLTGEQRYNQAMTLARRRWQRSMEAFIRGDEGMTTCLMDMQREALIRELDRASRLPLPSAETRTPSSLPGDSRS